MFADNGALRFADDQNGYTEIARMFTGLNGDPTIEMGNGTSAWGRIGSVNGLALWGNGDADVSNNPHVYLDGFQLNVNVDAVFNNGFVVMEPSTTTLVNGGIGFYGSIVDFQSGNIGLNDNQLRLRTLLTTITTSPIMAVAVLMVPNCMATRRYPCRQATWKSYFVTAEWV